MIDSIIDMEVEPNVLNFPHVKTLDWDYSGF